VKVGDRRCFFVCVCVRVERKANARGQRGGGGGGGGGSFSGGLLLTPRRGHHSKTAFFCSTVRAHLCKCTHALRLRPKKSGCARAAAAPSSKKHDADFYNSTLRPLAKRVEMKE
jgi:hypothetical protein